MAENGHNQERAGIGGNLAKKRRVITELDKRWERVVEPGFFGVLTLTVPVANGKVGRVKWTLEETDREE